MSLEENKNYLNYLSWFDNDHKSYNDMPPQPYGPIQRKIVKWKNITQEVRVYSPAENIHLQKINENRQKFFENQRKLKDKYGSWSR